MVSRIRAILIVLAAMSVFSSGGFEARSQDSEKKEDELVFAGCSDFAPYTFISEDGPAGYAVDLIKLISAAIGRDISVKLLPAEECVKQVKQGIVDGLVGVPRDKALSRSVDFSIPISNLEYAIFVDANNSYVSSLKSLEGTVVAVPEGPSPPSLTSKDLRITVLETSDVREGLEKITNREATALVSAKSVVFYYIQKDRTENIKIVGAPLDMIPYSLALSPSHKDLLTKIDKALLNFEKDGTMEKLHRKWFGYRVHQPFPWRTFILATSGITIVVLFLAAGLWVISLNATVKIKAQQIQLMSQKMVEKDKLAVLGKLAGQIAHELRTPLSIINNSIFLLRKEGTDNRELFEKRLHVLEEKVKLSSNILESILSYSRVKAEMASMISIKECVEEVVKDLQEPEGITLKLELPASPLFVFMDFHQLYSVLRNIAINGIQAMGETGTLTIQVYRSEGDHPMVNIKVADTGGGIAESAKNKIFNLFYSTKITGTGLGLPISKSIIEANGGTLMLEESNDKGTSFVVKLPAVKKGKNEPVPSVA
ncbi:MAG: transporter substrate-binding domain-containing protein [Candidatus Omnitrophica bacterium]|nr:transporter substrate-binding domain-containing protein [Candidatus Omnitrophota bacterium]